MSEELEISEQPESGKEQLATEPTATTGPDKEQIAAEVVADFLESPGEREENEKPEQKLKFSREDLEAILNSKDYEPEKLIALLEKNFSSEYAADSGTWEGYTIKEHTLMVSRLFEKYFADKMPDRKNLMRVMLSLHDIGKGRAAEEDDLNLQHKYTLEILRPTLANLQYDEPDIKIASALVKADTIGEYIRLGDREQAVEEIKELSEEAGLPTEQFLELLLTFHKVDAGSYTKEAGGKPSLERLFEFDNKNNELRYIPSIEEGVDRLKADLVGQNDITEPEVTSSKETGRDAKAKIRRFVDDPNLKFHFAKTKKMASILGKGILSAEFGKRAGVSLNEDYSDSEHEQEYTEPRSVSIFDREKQPLDPKRVDFYVNVFLQEGSDVVGFLLPDDLKVRKGTPQPTESIAPIRIPPKKIEGMFMQEHPTLNLTPRQKYEYYKKLYPNSDAGGKSEALRMVEDYFGITQSQLENIDPELKLLNEQRMEISRKFRNDHPSPPWDDTAAVNNYESERLKVTGPSKEAFEDRLEEAALKEISKIIDKEPGSITEQDILVYYAKKQNIPFYTVSKDFKSQTVIWPKQAV